MSAIFGIVTGNGIVTAGQIAGMQAAMAHRAIDGRGYWQTANCFLGHHKLSLQTSSRGDEKPAEDERYVVVADARIDNRNDLKAKLGRNGQANDAALILAAYRQWGAACVDRLDGEFAFAIWDKEAKELLAATDHIGLRPLYYYERNGTLIFCSEMKGILAIKDTPNVFNEEAVMEYFFRQSGQAHTYNKEIFALKGGHKLTFKDRNISLSHYWSAAPQGKYKFTRDDDWAECLRDLLIKATEYRLATDMPVGITLSGGLDSSSLACISGKILESRNQPLFAFSSVLPKGHSGVERDERKHIEILGRHIPNLIQTYVEAPDVSPFSRLEEGFEMEESIPNAFFYMDRALHEAAQEKNVRVLFTGVGGDFLVSQRAHFVLYELVKKGKAGAAIQLLRTARQYEKSYWQLLKTDYIAFTRLYRSYEAIRDRQKTNWQYFVPLQKDFLDRYPINRKKRRSAKEEMQDYFDKGNAGRLAGVHANRYAAFDMQLAMPMIDRHIVEFMQDVPAVQYMLNGERRSLIRRAMKGILPEEIRLRRDKQAYSPDYSNRLIKDNGYISEMLNKYQSVDYIWKYLDRELLEQNIHSIERTSGMVDLKKVKPLRIGQSIYVMLFLIWLNKNKYKI